MPLDPPRLESALALAGVSGGSLSAALAVVASRSALAGSPVGDVIGQPGERKPLVIDGPWLYTERMRLLEERFSRRVRERVARGSKPRDPRAVMRAVAAIAEGPPPLTDEQKRAVRSALGTQLALVTGGPGTGKTTIVVALVRALAWLGERMESIAIAAPTGKAAQRLRESLAAGLTAPARDLSPLGLRGAIPDPVTLHRLLGWSPRNGRFARHENDPLPQRIVVVDEGSMIDLAMMDRLLRALHPDASLVLLGDTDQLPSVEAGAVFRDLCMGLSSVRLTHNLRVAAEPSARRIVAVAGAVNAGVLGPQCSDDMPTRGSVREVALEGVEHLALPWAEVGDAILDLWWRQHVVSDGGFGARVSRAFQAPDRILDPADTGDLVALFDLFGRARILCATRVMGPSTSAEAVNERILARMRGTPDARGRRATHVPVGTPVVVGRNDYERQIFNGDQGVVLRIDTGDGDGPRPMAVFRRGEAFEAFPLESLPDLDVAFAMTVHKAQGSEFDNVLLVLPETDLPVVTRELIYTAVTRARRSVLIVGIPELLTRAVARVVERYSGIVEKLQE